MEASEEQDFENLLDHIQTSHNIDFHGYKRLSLKRRMLQRMRQVGIDVIGNYSDYLDQHPDELTNLFNAILINVTTFFRDQAAWDYLAKEVIPQILNDKGEEEPIRVWSAGCASGQEPYTLAMVLAEAIGVDVFADRVKIYGTDMDEDALNKARYASFSASAVQDIPKDLLSKYFIENSGQYQFRADLRRPIIFGSHDVTKDAPISRLDLLVCRNTLMYFNPATQKRVLNYFHFALSDNGFLFLGKAETLLSHPGLFTPVDMGYHIYCKKSRFNDHERMFFMADTSQKAAEPALNQTRLEEAAIERSSIAQVVLDEDGLVTIINQRARELFDLERKDAGRPFKELELSYRPAELRSVIERVKASGQQERLQEVVYTPAGGEAVFLDIVIMPLKGRGKKLLGVSLTFEDITGQHQADENLRLTNQNLENLNRELQSTQEELETTNEELESANEELETTNEELQSANEELETINEELQSTNEELITMNEDHRMRVEELNVAHAFLQSILSSLHAGVAVVDQHLNLILWNRRAEDLWGVRADEVLGKSLLSLDIGLPVEKIPMRDFMNGTAEYQEFSMKAVNRRGKNFQCYVECTPFTNALGQHDGIVLIMQDSDSVTKSKRS